MFVDSLDYSWEVGVYGISVGNNKSLISWSPERQMQIVYRLIFGWNIHDANRVYFFVMRFAME